MGNPDNLTKIYPIAPIPMPHCCHKSNIYVSFLRTTGETKMSDPAAQNLTNSWLFPFMPKVYKLIHQFLHAAVSVRHIWLSPELNLISCLLPRLLYMIDSFLPCLSMWFCFLASIQASCQDCPCDSSWQEAESHGVLTGSHFSCTAVLEGSKEIVDTLSRSQIWQTVLAGSEN